MSAGTRDSYDQTEHVRAISDENFRMCALKGCGFSRTDQVGILNEASFSSPDCSLRSRIHF
jgi:hypothetical protein